MSGTWSVYCYSMQSTDSSGNSNWLSVVFSLFKLDPVTKEEKTKSKSEIWDHTMFNKVANLIKHTDNFYFVGRSLMYVIYQWNMQLKQEEMFPFIYVSHTGLGWERSYSTKKTQTPEKERKLVKTRDKLWWKLLLEKLQTRRLDSNLWILTTS